MKIGIVSFYQSQQNYGQILQCYAMQYILRNMGHEAFHLRYYKESPNPFIKKFGKALSVLLHGEIFDIIRILKNRLNHRDSENVFQKRVGSFSRGFDGFKNKYLVFSNKEYSINELKANPPQADVWVAGSDQIWCHPSEIFHLQFGNRDAKKIAYAVSMGGCEPLYGWEKRTYKKYLRSFDYVSLREEDGVETCKKLGCANAELVLDPTFLLNAEDYRKISKTAERKKPYLFLYLLGSPVGINVKEIMEWASANMLDVAYVASQGRDDDYDKVNPNPAEWMGLIDNADYVITNSFHGMVFSIIFNKKFLVLPIVGQLSRMNSRIYTTIESLGISTNRIYNGNLDDILENIDYKSVNNLLCINSENIKNKLAKQINKTR